MIETVLSLGHHLQGRYHPRRRPALAERYHDLENKKEMREDHATHNITGLDLSRLSISRLELPHAPEVLCAS